MISVRPLDFPHLSLTFAGSVALVSNQMESNEAAPKVREEAPMIPVHWRPIAAESALESSHSWYMSLS